ncbi:zinc ribbon-containing protein [Methanoplanus endosymbiosus]|uniref:Zinc ribbon-containing protein n=1 Tax=Methanoplanus endosymbiosus TaxID=33865 RepID=A0A9E7PQW8_9EURY|nr:zinc ribbon-containing protein [Methanoplanus endosymbiosus]UUX93296.1 zinc ribbon-containing protein [Methanoplanus endosymbiosus]
MKHSTGEAAGKGNYRCILCSEIIILKEDSEKLPACPRCDSTKWIKTDSNPE